MNYFYQHFFSTKHHSDKLPERVILCLLLINFTKKKYLDFGLSKIVYLLTNIYESYYCYYNMLS